MNPSMLLERIQEEVAEQRSLSIFVEDGGHVDYADHLDHSDQSGGW